MRLVCVLVCVVCAVIEAKPLYEGDVCKQGENGANWTCKRPQDCAKANQIKNEGRKIPSCPSTLVCCEAKNSGSAVTRIKRNQKSISQIKCEEYAKYVFLEIPLYDGEVIQHDLCQFTEPLISNGEDALPHEYPHMALIGYGSKDNIKWFCGGSLISERFVLSAAHCTSPDGSGNARWVRLGDHDISTDIDDKNGLADPMDFEIIERINHPDYDPHNNYNDIALYKLDRDVPLGEAIRPICLQTDYKINKKEVLATGWGNTLPGLEDTRSSVLQKVYLPIKPFRVCNASYKNFFGKKDKNGYVRLQNGIRDESMLCAGGKDGKDTCRADSGGPLQIRLATPHCMYSQIGITSFGKSCTGPTPGVYTRVSHYVPWIESVVWP